MDTSLTDKLISLFGPAVQAEGCRLFDLEYKHGHGSGMLRVYIDKEGGVGVEDCARISKQIGFLLDAEELIPDSYVLEVSSPGLTRALTKPSHFIGAVGKLALVSARRIGPEGKGGKVLGVIESADNEKLELRLKNGQLETIHLADITKARLEIEF